MNRIKLAYVRHCNTSKRIRKKRLQKHIDSGVQGIYDRIRPISTYKGARHTFFQLYKAMKMNPESKIIKIMVNENYLGLRAYKQKLKFAKGVYQSLKKELKELQGN